MPLGAAKQALLGAAGVSTSDVVLLATTVADGDSSIAFTSGIDSTYKEYIFSFETMHYSVDGQYFYFQAGASYNTAITSAAFRAQNAEDGSNNFGFCPANILGNETGEQMLYHELDNDNDSNLCGTLHLFNPSSTTYVKQWFSRMQGNKNEGTGVASMEVFTAGYLNTTSALTQVRFKPSSGNFDAGTIKMYGVK